MSVGSGIRRTVKKFSTPHQIIRFDRQTTDDEEYIGGIAQPLDEDIETINIHVQPIGSGDTIESLPEGQRQSDVKKGYTIEPIAKKDRLIIDDAYFTVNAIQKWPNSNHTECDLIRTGEVDNVIE